MKVLFHMFLLYWGKEHCSLHRGLLGCVEVRYIEVPLYFHFVAQNNSYNINYRKIPKISPSMYNPLKLVTQKTLR